jgi:hypothetical protein
MAAQLSEQQIFEYYEQIVSSDFHSIDAWESLHESGISEEDLLYY